MKRKSLFLTLLIGLSILCIGTLSFGENVEPPKKAYVIIIIDDFGNNMAGTETIAELPISLTAAVIPGMPYAKEDATKLYEAGKEIIYHVPLEPKQGKASWLGPKGILAGMGEEKVKEILDSAKEEIPYAKGMNNHMGSRAMENDTTVQALMAYAKANGLYFVDSKTTEPTLSKKWSEALEVPFMERDVFLDNTPDTAYIKERLKETMKIAKEKGVAVAIGHVGPQKGPHTARALKEMIPIMEKEGIEFITVSMYLDLIKWTKI